MKRIIFAIFIMLVWATPASAQSPGDQPSPDNTPPTATPPTNAPPTSVPNTAPPTTAPNTAPPITDPAAPPPVNPAAPPLSGGAPGVPMKEKATRSSGLMLGLSFGGTGCTNDACDDIDPLVFVRLQALYRVGKYFALGVHLSANFLKLEETFEESVTLWNLIAAPEFRVLIPLGKLDLWTGLAPGYYRRMFSAESGYSSWSHGLGLGWGLGALYYVASKFALGADFWLYKPVLFEACSKPSSGPQSCSEFENQDRIGITWAVGITATLWFGQ